MSSIEKMTIQGIRSFGPQKENMQRIDFGHPLTLILGCNGTGKTTIIECLKYITTGDQPPGTKGGAFVHDPKVAGEREVKAQVRFQFHDVMNKKTIITRSLTATQKKSKIECRTLDGVIQRQMADGTSSHITSKCADLNKEMIHALGVSKPILDSVIFCHQEESNWPLSEGKALKQRFDDIFASTRYVKALESIRKVKTTQTSETSAYKAEIKYLKQNKERAEELHNNMADVQMRRDQVAVKLDEVNEKLRPVQERKAQLTTEMCKLFEVRATIQNMTSEKKQLEKTMQELRSNIDEIFTGSEMDLEQTLADFQANMEEKQGTLKQFERRSTQLAREIDQVNGQRSQKLTKQGQLSGEAERHKENIKKRDAKIRKLASDYGFSGYYTEEITDGEIKAFGDLMRKKMEDLTQQADAIKTEYEAKESDLQRQLDSVREQKTRLEQSEKMNLDILTKNKKEMHRITAELSRVDASAGNLDQIKADLLRAEHELKEAEQTCNVEELKTEVKNLQRQKTTLDSKLRELSDELNRLYQQSSTKTQLDTLKKDKVTKDDKIRKLKSKHADTLAQLFSSTPELNFARTVTDYVQMQETETKQMTDKLNSMRMELSNKENNRKNLREQLKQKEDELKRYEEEVFQVCGGQDIDQGLATVQEKIGQVQDDRGAMVGGKHLYEKFIRRLSTHDPACPVCHRGFDEEREVQELIQELQDQLRLVPSKINKAEKDLDEQQKKYDRLIQLKPVKETMSKLQDEIPDLKNKVKVVSQQMEKLRNDIEEVESDLECKQVDESIAKSIQTDMALLDREMSDVADLDKKIAVLQAKLSGEDSDRSVQQVRNEQEETQLSLDTVNRSIDHKYKRIAEVTDQINALKSSINGLKSEKVQIESDLQQRCKLEESKAQLKAANEKLEQEVKDAVRQKTPLQTQIESIIRQKQQVSLEKDKKYETAKSEITDIKAKGADVKVIQKEIAKYLTEGRDELLEECQHQVEQLKAKETRLTNDRKEVDNNLDKLKKELVKQEVKERELTDNLQLCRKEKEVRHLEGKIERERVKLEGFNIEQLEQEERRLGEEMDRLAKERGKAQGELISYEARLDEKRKELSSEAYVNADEKFTGMLIKLRTTEVAIQDLDKYYKAMDQAIMRYHQLKMNEINKIIRELWSKTYKGNDIDYIEIRSDEDPDGCKARRSYNYRVVMVKGTTALDLRGRCSAGQKVLASIIIRLALAETFCLNCGVLTLDEPTTNLDRANIESLAQALIEIIHSREQQVNFQLIVITHDVDFIELLGREHIVDSYWRVSKDHGGCSRVKRQPISELE